MKKLLGLLLVVVGLALGLWFASRGAIGVLPETGTPEALSPDARRAGEVDARSLDELVRSKERSDAARSGPDDVPPTSTVRNRRRQAPGLHGTVSASSGPVAGATVFVRHGDPEAGGQAAEPLARTATASDGTYRLDLPVGVPLDVGVVAAGFLPDSSLDLRVSSAGRRHDVVLEEGLALEGRVVDAEGRPVPGLPLLAHPAAAALEHASSSLVALRAEEQRLAGRASSYCDGRATTGAGGEFRIAGLRAGDYLVRSEAPEWSLERRPQEAGGAGVVVHAKRCVALELRVREAGTGRPVPDARGRLNVHVAPPTGPERTFGEFRARGGRAGSVSWSLQPGFLERVGLQAEHASVTFSGELQAADYEVQPFRTEPVSATDGKAVLTVWLTPE